MFSKRVETMVLGSGCRTDLIGYTFTQELVALTLTSIVFDLIVELFRFVIMAGFYSLCVTFPS